LSGISFTGVKVFKKIKQWFKSLFIRPKIVIVIKDDLAPLEDITIVCRGVKLTSDNSDNKFNIRSEYDKHSPELLKKN
jgi:hypothetical protein